MVTTMNSKGIGDSAYNRQAEATIEISLNDFHIIQYRAFANGICEYTKQIESIINANKKMIAERKRA